MLESIVDASPEFYLAWYNLGLAYDDVDDDERADHAYLKAIELESSQQRRDASL
jgi:Tfp pilus assembly protein PilF